MKNELLPSEIVFFFSEIQASKDVPLYFESKKLTPTFFKNYLQNFPIRIK